jgi:hypothetical protein
MDRLRAFEVFATVVDQGSFTRAADKLETSPANVTRYVNELEASLGARLLNRTSPLSSIGGSFFLIDHDGQDVSDETYCGQIF